MAITADIHIVKRVRSVFEERFWSYCAKRGEQGNKILLKMSAIIGEIIEIMLRHFDIARLYLDDFMCQTPF